mmetsp:Transcript_2424/g.3799  ORF Transcript_2424/g.3799 Transcript_2424/m.3799 type:complete len:355 (+) Transcript_2424:303-1367(+)
MTRFRTCARRPSPDQVANSTQPSLHVQGVGGKQETLRDFLRRYHIDGVAGCFELTATSLGHAISAQEHHQQRQQHVPKRPQGHQKTGSHSKSSARHVRIVSPRSGVVSGHPREELSSQTPQERILIPSPPSCHLNSRNSCSSALLGPKKRPSLPAALHAGTTDDLGSKAAALNLAVGNRSKCPDTNTSRAPGIPQRPRSASFTITGRRGSGSLDSSGQSSRRGSAQLQLLAGGAAPSSSHFGNLSLSQRSRMEQDYASLLAKKHHRARPRSATAGRLPAGPRRRDGPLQWGGHTGHQRSVYDPELRYRKSGQLNCQEGVLLVSATLKKSVQLRSGYHGNVLSPGGFSGVQTPLM